MSGVIDTPQCSTKRKSEELASRSQNCYVPSICEPKKKKKKKGNNKAANAAVSGDSSNNQTQTMTKKMRRQLREQERLEKNKAKNKAILDGTFLTKRQKRKLRKNLKTVGAVLLSTSVKEHIQQILNSYVPTSFLVDDNSYANVSDSSFKREFISSIRGKLEERLLPYSLDSKRDSRLDQMYYDELASKQDTDFVYRSLQKKREILPAHNMKNVVLQSINSSQVVVISGETGCGKTTQIPQFILDDSIENKQGSMCRIVCTQPRRISAVAVAERVAEERHEELGISCGYSIRLERELPRDRASMVFCTVGIVLRHLEKDPSLKSISHLIIDEIHEREIKIDFLICIVKQIIAVRKDLKVILMSATLNAEAFSAYFDNAPHINLPGFTFPVEEYYLEDVLERVHFQFPQKTVQAKKAIKELKKYVESLEPFARSLAATGRYSSNTIEQLLNPLSKQLNMDLVFALLVDICEKEYRPGAVLVFLPGFGDISNLMKLIEASGKFPMNRYIIIPLHSKIPTINQKEIFHPAPPYKRKIIIATNIAETSITIDDVVYVIDCGKMKVVNYNPSTNIQSLEVDSVSIANATQRKGRAGRTQSGKCFHLFSSFQRSRMAPFLKPEILRRRLEDTILSAKKLQVGKIDVFFKKLMDAPSDRAVKASLDLLKRLNAIDNDENLTPLGYHMSKLPLAPQIGKMLLFGILFSCLDPILSIAASLDFKDPFLLPFGKERQVTKKRFELADGVKSDHYLLYRAMNRFENARDKRSFCHDFFLSFQTMTMLVKLKGDFMRILYQMEFVNNYDSKDPKYNFNSGNISLIKAIICGGLYPNIVIAKRTGAKKIQYKLPGGQNVRIHPKSILGNDSQDVFLESSLLVYYLLMKSSRNFIYDATMIHPLPVIMFGDRFEHVTLDDGAHISIGEGLLFKCSMSTLGLIKELKCRLDWFLANKISHPGIVDWHQQSPDIDLLRTISNMITNEAEGNLELDAYDDHDEVAPVIIGDETNKKLVKPTHQKQEVSAEEIFADPIRPKPQGAEDLEDISEEEKTNRQGVEDLEDISEDEKTYPQGAEDLEDISEDEKTDPQRAENLEDISEDDITDDFIVIDEDSDEEIMNLPW